MARPSLKIGCSTLDKKFHLSMDAPRRYAPQPSCFLSMRSLRLAQDQVREPVLSRSIEHRSEILASLTLEVVIIPDRAHVDAFVRGGSVGEGVDVVQERAEDGAEDGSVALRVVAGRL